MRFVVKRLGLFVVALFGLSLLVFVLLRMLPGDVAAVMSPLYPASFSTPCITPDTGGNSPESRRPHRPHKGLCRVLFPSGDTTRSIPKEAAQG